MFKVLAVLIGVSLLCVACDSPTSPVTVNNITRMDTLAIIDTITHTDTLTITDTVTHTDTITQQSFVPVIVRDTVIEHDTVYVSNISSGYRYYRFVVDSAGLAGPNCVILTETDFIKGSQHYPTPGTMGVISNSPIEIGDINALFDTDMTTGSTTGNYVKFTSTPWEWVIDMKQAIKFDSFFLSSWQIYFYQEPSKVSIYGSMSPTGNWTLIGRQVFTQIYQSTMIPLTY